MLALIILLSVVSFFADIAYEGARGIVGPFFALLGASGAAVGTFAGLAEFAGYGIRLFSGMFADRWKNYWLLTAVGYTCNLLVIPLFALVSSWQTAALLLVLERAGKALRTPSRDAMLSYACKEMGRGWGFGLHEAFDRFGGLLGPLFMFGILTSGPHFKLAFALLSLPSALALVTLYIAYKKFPHPEVAEPSSQPFSLKNFSRPFWIFMAGAALVGAGTLNFALISYHLEKNGMLATPAIPLLYMVAIAVSAAFALVGGKWFDSAPKAPLYFGIAVGSLGSPFLLLGTSIELWIGAGLWAIGMGTQTALFRSGLALLIPAQQRSTGYGIFGLVYGVAWFLGSTLMGTLYDSAVIFPALASFILQLLALPLVKKVPLKN